MQVEFILSWHWQILQEGAKHLDMFGPAVGPPTPLRSTGSTVLVSRYASG